MSDTTDAIREILASVTINRTRGNTRLSNQELDRIMEAISPPILALEVKEEAAPAPKWYGVTVAVLSKEKRPLITTDKKADVLVEFIRQNDLEDIADKIQGTSEKDEDSSKRVFYYYSVNTKQYGPLNFYVVHSDYLDRLPEPVLEVMNELLSEEAAEDESEETEDESEEA